MSSRLEASTAAHLNDASNGVHSQDLQLRQDVGGHVHAQADLGTAQTEVVDGGGISGGGGDASNDARGQASAGCGFGRASVSGVVDGIGVSGARGEACRGSGGARGDSCRASCGSGSAGGGVCDTQAARQLRACLFERPAPVLVAALEQLETIVRGDETHENGVDADAGCAVSLGATKGGAPAHSTAPGDGGAGAGASTCVPSSSSSSSSTSSGSSAKASASKSTSSTSAGGLAAVQCAEWVGRMWLETGVPHSELMGAKQVDISLTCR